MKKQGKFIVIEGLEGAGKSTAIKWLEELFHAKGISPIVTHEPGGTHAGHVIRKLLKEHVPQEPILPLAELLLFYASRVQLLSSVICPALEQGRYVLADRFELSTFAYQGGGRGLDEGLIQHLSQACVGQLKPDLILFLDISPEEGLRRARHRGPTDRIEQEAVAFFTAVHQAYHRLIPQLDHVVVVDAHQPMEAVKHSILSTVSQLL